jgi:hypothetical protein
VEPKLISVLLENLPGPDAPANGPLAIIPPLKFLDLAKIVARLFLPGSSVLNDKQLIGADHLQVLLSLILNLKRILMLLLDNQTVALGD